MLKDHVMHRARNEGQTVQLTEAGPSHSRLLVKHKKTYLPEGIKRTAPFGFGKEQ